MAAKKKATAKRKVKPLCSKAGHDMKVSRKKKEKSSAGRKLQSC
jgi:hypothetical protein